MRNLLSFLAAVCLTVAVSGWYLGWYTVETPPAPTGRRNVNIEIITIKIGEDIQRGSERLQDLLKDLRHLPAKAAGPKSPAARCSPMTTAPRASRR